MVRGTRRKPDRVRMGARRAPRTRYVPAMLLSDRINGRLVSPDIRRTKANSPAKGTSYETSRKVGGSQGSVFLFTLASVYAAMLSQRYSWNFLIGQENVLRRYLPAR